MTLVSDAACFAAMAHDGTFRKGTDIPYITHPMETAAIAASITSDEEILAAALLHDVIEDCGVTRKELEARFGARVAALVANETQKAEGDPRRTWVSRKRMAIEQMAKGDRAMKIIALGDKLSNMRAIHRDYDLNHDAMFFRFHQHDKRLHAWYYRSCMEMLRSELGDTEAWRELRAHIEHVFEGVAQISPDGEAEVWAG